MLALYCSVATSIAEEGLDIGEVDLVISCDVLSSQLRIVQRFGRTGRKRTGRCVTLVMKGTEEEKYRIALLAKNALNKQLRQNGQTPSWLQKRVPRMLPPQITPTPQYVSIRQAPGGSAGGKASRKRGRGASAAGKKDESPFLSQVSSARFQAIRAQGADADEEEEEEDVMLLTSGCPGPIWAVQHSSATLRLLAVIDDMHHSVTDEGVQSAAAQREEMEAIEFKQRMDALFSGRAGGASSQSPDAVMRSASPADRSATPPITNRAAGGASSKANGAAASVVPLSRRLDAELALVPMNKPIASMFQRHEQQQAQKLQEIRAAREARREAAGKPPRRSKYIELSFVSAHAQLPPDVATTSSWLRSHALSVVAVTVFLSLQAQVFFSPRVAWISLLPAEERRLATDMVS